MRIVLIKEGYFEPPRDSMRERMSYLFLTIMKKRPWIMTSMTFVRKITRILADIDATEVDDTVPAESGIGDLCTCLSLSSFCPLTESDVSALIKKSTKKCYLMVPMPTSLVVCCLDVLLPVITSKVNSSLSSGYFPAE